MGRSDLQVSRSRTDTRDPARVVIENVRPQSDAGRFAVKRVVGDRVIVEADVFADGHDALAGVLRHQKEGASKWHESPLHPRGNDRWQGAFQVTETGRWLYTLSAWSEPFATWQHDLSKRVQAGQEVKEDLRIGAELVRAASRRASGDDRQRLEVWAAELEGGRELASQTELALGTPLTELMRSYPDRSNAVDFERQLVVVVDRERARFSTWYELFPRSCARKPGEHGTFKDCEARLSDLSAMGFDVLYLPPIHPIGWTHRKGRNNAVTARPEDPGSPWGIGSESGGHKSVHPQLGTLEDFRSLVAAAHRHGIEVALDIALQCSPDHPYVQQHPEWFRKRPDGSIQYAENPPKKYQDIYPFDFETSKWRELWNEMKAVVEFWIDQGVRIFRVDNPHTKPFHFWEWLIGEIKSKNPDVLFLAEAFTRPRVMYRLAKLGFTQSYTYFAWRNTKWELSEYFKELNRPEIRDVMRPNLWPNTPDILTETLQFGGRPAFMARLCLAATLGASYGIYGPAFELCENQAREPGSEEYLDSEKYEIKHWDLDRPGNLRSYITRVNRIRRENPALQRDWSLAFHPVDNEQLLCYSKHSEDLENIIIVVVNLDFHHTQSGWLDLPLEAFGLDPHQPYQAHDLLTEARFLWDGPRNFVQLNPHESPAHILRIRRRIRREHDFEYYF